MHSLTRVGVAFKPHLQFWAEPRTVGIAYAIPSSAWKADCRNSPSGYSFTGQQSWPESVWLLSHTFPAQPILLRTRSLLRWRATRIKHLRRICQCRWQRRIRLLQQMRIQSHVINALIRCNPCQIIRACSDVGGPVRSGITSREIHRIQNIYEHEAKNQPQNTRDRPVRCKQKVAYIQMDQSQKDPVE
jgi:hypothetical protein